MNIQACLCILAGTEACQVCSQNPNAITPPPVRSYTIYADDKILITGRKTNADRIRTMSNEELAMHIKCPHWGEDCIHLEDDVSCLQCKEDWLKEVKDEEG